MGILNVTPDSFHDGGRHLVPDRALGHAEAMARSGADIIDVGGESSRPGARAVGEQEEMDRVLPVIEAIRARLDITLSIDTTKPAVMRAAVAAGAGLVNDINGLRADGALGAVAGLGVPVCLMHMQGEPATMQASPEYGDVVREVHGFLAERAQACITAGIDPRHIILDPGFGFGKRLGHNLALLHALPQLVGLGYPVLAGVSRKSMIGMITGNPGADRLPGSLVLAMAAWARGVRILRVHDVAETAQALAVSRAIAGQIPPGEG
ncbi:MAG: dihydropteroate synthase [Chromatiales bacterium]|nr:dihydropteroate synthase [Chromatiales bacterium]